MRQGEVYWFRFAGHGSEPEGRRPALVIQHDRFNRSAIQTTIVAAITSNLRLAAMPGNVRLRKGEANLPRPSIVNVTQLRTIDRERLTEKVGHLAPDRVREVLEGLALVLGLDGVPRDHAMVSPPPRASSSRRATSTRSRRERTPSFAAARARSTRTVEWAIPSS